MNNIIHKLTQCLVFLLFACFSVIASAVPTFSIAFSPSTIGPGSVSTLTYTIDNSAETTPVSGLAFTNTLPTGMTIANTPNAVSTCSNGNYTATSGASNISFNDYRLGKLSSCTLSIDVTSATGGTHTNTPSALTSSAGSVSAASADLIVDLSRPGFSVALSPSTIAPDGVSTLTYTIDNSLNGADANFRAFTTNLPSGVLVSQLPNLSTSCTVGNDGVTAVAFASVITGDTVSLTAGSTCTISVDITAATVGAYDIYSGDLTFFGNSASGGSNTLLNVERSFLDISFPASVTPGSSATLTFGILNNNRDQDITALTFTDDLNAALSGLEASVLPSTGFCGSGSTMSGTSNLTISGVNLTSGDSCSFDVTVLIPLNAAAGSYINTTSTISYDLAGSSTTSSASSNTISVYNAPTVSMSFMDDPINTGEDVTLRFTITNTDTNNAATGITFTQNINDTFSGTDIKTLPDANSCGTGSTFANSTTNGETWFLNVNGGSLSAAASCTFDVILTTPTDGEPGSYAFTTSFITATVAGAVVSDVPASDNLVIVAAPALSLSIVESSIEPGDTVNAEFTLNYNENSTANATNVTFTVDLDNALSGMTTSTASQTDVCGSGSTFSGTDTLTLTGGSLIPDSTCTFSVALQIPSDAIPSIITMDSSAVSATTSGMSVTSATASDTLLISGLSLTQEFVGNPALPGAIITSRYTISNHADALAATAMSFNHNYQLIIPTFTAIALPTTPCNGSSTLSGTTNLIFSAGELQPGENCTFDVSLQVPLGASEGVFNSATSSMSATVNGNNTANSAANSTLIIEQLTVLLSTNEASPTSITPFSVAVNFSRNVTGLTASDFVVGNGTASNLQGSDASYTVDITPTTDGSVTIDLPANVVNDAVDNSVQNPGASQLTIVYASVPATATPSLTISAPSVSATDTGPVIYTVTYANAAEVNLTSSSITLNNGGTSATATVTVTDGSSTTSTVTLSDISGDGTLGVSIAAGTARNGNEVAASAGPSNTFVVDNTSPSLNAYSPSQNAVDVSVSTTQLILTFSETVIANTSNNLIEIKNVADNAVIYSFAADSSAVVITGNTATVSFSPALPESRALYVTVAANAFKDALGHVFAGINDDSTWRFTIINRPPVISGAPAAQVAEDSNYSFTPAVSDVDVYDTAAFSIVNAPSWASFDTTTGTLTGTPDNDDVGVTSGIVITVTDSAGAQASLAAFSITVGNINDAPVITGTPAAQVDEDSNYSFTPSVSDVDAGDTAAFSIVNAPSWADFSAITGALTGTPTNDDVGVTAGIVITATDSASAQVSLAAFSITVSNTNDAPVAVADSYTLNEGDSLSTTGVLINDSDIDAGSVITAVLVSNVSHGSLTLNSDGSFTYTHDDSETISDNFTYKANDTLLDSNTVTVTLIINPENDAPLANDDTLSVNEDAVVQIAVLDNDIDSEGFLLASSTSIMTAPSNGATRLNTANGVITYTPDVNFNGSDSFTYQVSDGQGVTSNVATVSIVVVAVNDAPVMSNDIQTTNEDVATLIDVLANDTDVDGDTVSTVIIDTQPSNGSVTIENDKINYQPNSNFEGTDSFTYYAQDSTGAIGNAATVTINITGDNDLPRAVNDSAITDEDTPVSIDVLANDSDVDGGIDGRAVSMIGAPSQGSININSVNGAITYTPSANFNGEDSFTYVVKDVDDGTSNEATVSITINPINDAPVANDDSVTNLFEDISYPINVLGNDSDTENGIDSSTVSIDREPDEGSVSVDPTTGVISYTPGANYFGSDSFTYRVSDDGTGSAGSMINPKQSNVAKVNLTIASVNDLPVANDDIYSVAEDSNANSFNILNNDNDIDGSLDETTVTLLQSVTNGSLSINNDGTVDYVPSANYVGSDSFIYTVNDNEGGISNTALVNITVIATNDAPVAVNDSARVNENSSTNIGVLANDSDSDGDTLTVTSAAAVNGTVSINSNGRLNYSPNANFNGTDTITYGISDSNDGNASATVSVTVAALNDAPVISGTPATQVAEGDNYSFTPTVSDVDVGDVTTFSISGNPQWMLFNTKTGAVSGTPIQADVDVTSDVTITVNDNSGADNAIDSISFSVIVSNINQAPEAVADSFVFDLNNTNTYTLDVLSNDTDVDGDALSITGANASIGSVTIDGASLIFTTQAGFVGQVEITYAITDGNDTFVTTTVDVLIEGDSNQSAPIITAPAALEVDAIGLYTRVELGVATATNSLGQPIPVSLVAGQPLFRPGNNIVYWQAEDSQGLKSVASQSVVVYPLISMSQDKTSVEGTSHDVRVFLNGPSPIYPVIIGYSVSGSADANDHNLISGEIVIESGEVGSISFDVLADDMSEESETLTITLDDTLNLGAKSAYTLTIVEQNIAPQVTYSVTQDNEQRLLIENNAGQVVIQTEVFDSNTLDTHQYQWLNSESYLVDVDNDETTYTFDTTGLTAGIQTLKLVVTDNGDTPLSTETNIYLEITDTLAVLTDIDSDGDLIPDNEEGLGDDDFDGIPNYLDVPSACNVMPQQVSESQAFLVEGEAGVCLRKGATVANNKSGGLELSPDELPNDEETLNVGGIFDFIVYGLPQAGQSFNLVLPQLQPIPANALYRKFTRVNGWVDFVVDVNNQFASSQGNLGFCPPPGDASWSIGLNEGHWCVQLTIEDGGPNDDDGLANSSINDPGGVSVMLTDNTPPEAQADIVRVKGNESLIIDVLSNDSDADGDMLNISTVNAMFGVVTITFDNQLSYQSQTDFIGEDRLVYTVSDGNGGSASATVNITVYGNDGPIAVNDSANTDDRTPIDINVLGNDSDTDGDNLTVVSATVDEGSVAINGDNTLTYTPVSGFVGAATIIYIVDDGQGAQATAQAIVNVKTFISITVNKKSSGGSLALIIFALMGLVLYRLLCQRLHQQLCQPLCQPSAP